MSKISVKSKPKPGKTFSPDRVWGLFSASILLAIGFSTAISFLSLTRSLRDPLCGARYHKTGQVLTDAMTEQWLYSVWLKDTRYYAITLCQDLFSNWIVKCTWGRDKTHGAGQSNSTVCDDYEQALTVYKKEQTRRFKRSYVMQQENFRAEET